MGQPGIAKWSWLAGTVPEILALGISMARGRMESDAVALISMIAALALGAEPALIVVAVMCGGNVPEDFAVARERVRHSLSVSFRFGILKAALACLLNRWHRQVGLPSDLAVSP